MRHSGPSIDLALGHRSLREAKKRGRWMSDSTVLRYERHARLGAEWSKLSPAQRELFAAGSKHPEDVALNRPHGC
eukprot:8177027-Lingulodinium_polyedra.AAC.1